MNSSSSLACILEGRAAGDPLWDQLLVRRMKSSFARNDPCVLHLRKPCGHEECGQLPEMRLLCRAASKLRAVCQAEKTTDILEIANHSIYGLRSGDGSRRICYRCLILNSKADACFRIVDDKIRRETVNHLLRLATRAESLAKKKVWLQHRAALKDTANEIIAGSRIYESAK